MNVKMPKFLKTCGNELHKEWCGDTLGKLINLKTNRLAAILNGFKALKTGGKFQQPNICSLCLQICRRKREFTRNLESHESLEKVNHP